MPQNHKGEPVKDYFRVSHKIIENEYFKDLKPGSQILYLHLCRLRNKYARSNGVFFRSLERLIKDTGLARATIVSARQELKTKGLVWIISKPYGRTRWRLFEPGETPEDMAQWFKNYTETGSKIEPPTY